MDLIKYRDEQNGEKNYSYFWVHDFRDGNGEVVVSEIFATKQDAINWADNVRQVYFAQKNLGVTDENNL